MEFVGATSTLPLSASLGGLVARSIFSHKNLVSFGGVNQLNQTHQRSWKSKRTGNDAPDHHHVSLNCRCSAIAEPASSSTTSSSTLYGVLGVDHMSGSISDIKMAYRKMARMYHPDVCPLDKREECTQKFLEVQHAYEVLSDPEKKADYDYALLHPLFAQALEMGAGSSWQNSRGSRRTRGTDGASDAWRIQWEVQLSRLRQRNVNPTCGNPVTDTSSSATSSTWGARMRRQTHAQWAAALFPSALQAHHVSAPISTCGAILRSPNM